MHDVAVGFAKIASYDETIVKSTRDTRACKVLFLPFQYKKRNERKKRYRESNRQLHKIEPIKS